MKLTRWCLALLASSAMVFLAAGGLGCGKVVFDDGDETSAGNACEVYAAHLAEKCGGSQVATSGSGSASGNATVTSGSVSAWGATVTSGSGSATVTSGSVSASATVTSGSATAGGSVTCSAEDAALMACFDGCLAEMDCGCAQDPSAAGCAATMKPYSTCIGACAAQ